MPEERGIASLGSREAIMPEQRWPIGTTFDPIRTYDTGIGQIDPNLVRYLRGAADTQTATTPATQQMVPVDPSFRDRLEMLLSDTFGHTPVGRRRANMFMDALEWIPGVDEGLLFSDAGEEIEQGNLITGGVLGGLGALSMAPFVPPGAGRSLEEIMKSLKKKVKKRPDDTPVIPDSGEGKRYDSNLPVSDHAQGRRTREADIRRQQELDLRPEAKLARAKDQDFNVDRPLYHQTDTTFTEFKLQTPPQRVYERTRYIPFSEPKSARPIRPNTNAFICPRQIGAGHRCHSSQSPNKRANESGHTRTEIYIQ